MRLISIRPIVISVFVVATFTPLMAKPQDAPLAARSTGTIAYTNGREVRLIDSDGGNDRLVWAVPDTAYSISRLAWSPDGEEIAFASDHEMAISLYERDIYGIRPDGSELRKLTQPPLHEELASYDTGTVTVTVSNFSGDGGPFFVYVPGAAEPQQVIINPGSSRNLEFTDVADLGDDVFQHVVVISGIFRWWDAAVAADVIAGGTVSAGSLNLTSAYEHYGADGPFWRSDGTRIGYFQTAGFAGTSTCIIEQIPVPAPFGFYSDPIFDPELFETPCAVDWAPVPALADQLLVTDYSDYTENGEVHVYRVTEGSDDKGELIVTIGGYVQIYDIRWLPDASGFIVARHDALLERGLNLYEHSFDNETVTKLTDFTGEEEGVRSFSISPDGQFITYEYVTSADDRIGDTWIMRRDGTDRRLLVAEAGSPHWNSQDPSVSVDPPAAVPSLHGLLTVYPHPVGSSATLSFHLQQPQSALLTVHDALGRRMLVRDLGARASGKHRTSLDATTYSPGIYFVSVVGSAGERKFGQVVVVK